MKTKILLLLLFVLTTSLFGQVCGTLTDSKNQDFSHLKVKMNHDPVCINVRYHILRNDNGIGGINSNQLDGITNLLNEVYNEHDLYINDLGFDFIDDTTYFNISSDTEFEELVQINNQEDAINIYLVDSATGYLGRANGILSQAFVVVNNSADTNVVSHELGHCLNLWHTFQGTKSGTSGCAEFINGSSPNCLDCGDYVCDTPADNGNGTSNGYNPDMFNIMSYYDDINRLTNGQSERIRLAILGSPILQQVRVEGGCSAPEGPSTICSVMSSGEKPPTNTTYLLEGLDISFPVNWNVSPNLEIITSVSNSITVRPINALVNEMAFVEAVYPSYTIRKEIWIGNPILTFTAELDEENIAYDAFIGVEENQNIISVEWEVLSGNGNIIPNTSNNFYADISGGAGEWLMNGKVTVINDCGETVKYFTLGNNPPPENIYQLCSLGNDIYKVSKSGSKCSSSEKRISKKVNMIVYNIYGRPVVSTAKSRIDLSNLKQGIYIINVIISNELITKKIIKY